MQIRRVCVIGGDGFIGRHLVHVLGERGKTVVVPTRRREKAKALILLPTVDVIEIDLDSDAGLARAIAGADAVVNLAGTRTRRGYARTHDELPRRIAAACAAADVARLIHLSALGADASSASLYLRSKAAGEAAVRASHLAWTIFRPAAVFGRDDRLLNIFATVQRRLPVLPLPDARARVQPVYVEDVAHAIAHALDNPATAGATYALCGPRVYGLRELAVLAGRLSGHARPILALGTAASALLAAVLERLPGTLLTRDELKAMRGGTCTCDGVFPFGLEPAAIEGIAALQFGAAAPRARYNGYRAHGQ